MKEEDFASQIEDLLRHGGWLWTHFRPAWSDKGYRTPISGDKGFPDYVAIKGEDLLFIELKGDGGSLSPEQKDWRLALLETEAEYYCWWPKDFELARQRLWPRESE